MGLYKVTTLLQFKHVYFIEGKELSHALDEVTMRESGNDADYFEEAQQQYLGETIIDGEEVSHDDFHKFLDRAKEEKDLMVSHWLGDKLIHKIPYESSKNTMQGEQPENTTVTISVYDGEENMGFEGTVTFTPDVGREVFKQMGTSLILGRPDIGKPDIRESSRYDRWTRTGRGY